MSQFDNITPIPTANIVNLIGEDSTGKGAVENIFTALDRWAGRRNSPFLGNWSLPIYRAALAALRAGGPGFNIVFPGGSSTMGLGATGTSSDGNNGLVDSYRYSYPSVVARALASAGIPVRNDAFNGDNNSGTRLSQYRPNITLGTDWTIAQVGRSAAANGVVHNGVASSLTIAPPALPVEALPYDRARIIYVNRAASGSPFTVTVDGGAALTPIDGGSSSINTNGADITKGVVEFNITGAMATHTLSINAPAPSGGMSRVEIADVMFTNSTKGEINICNLGTSGASADFWANTSPAFKRDLIWNSSDLTSLNPKLSVFLLTNNDLLQKMTKATFKANLTALVVRALTTGDVILCIQQPMAINAGVGFDNADTSAAKQASFRAAILEIAADMNLAVYDGTAILPSYQDGVTMGKFYDPIHANGMGLFDYGVPLGRALAA